MRRVVLKYIGILVISMIACDSPEEPISPATKSYPSQKGLYPDSIQQVINQIAIENKLLGYEAELHYLRHLDLNSDLARVENEIWNLKPIQIALDSDTRNGYRNRMQLISTFGHSTDTLFINVVEEIGLTTVSRFHFRYYNDHLFYHDLENNIDVHLENWLEDYTS